MMQKKPACGLAASVLLYGPQVQAVATIKVTVTIVVPPPCVINNNNLIEVNFGTDVMTTCIDGSTRNSRWCTQWRAKTHRTMR
jgi:spore coat protein U-like protein